MFLVLLLFGIIDSNYCLLLSVVLDSLNFRLTCSEIGMGPPSSSILTKVIDVVNIITSSSLNTLYDLTSTSNVADVFPILFSSLYILSNEPSLA